MDRVCRRGRPPSYRALLHQRPLAIRSRNPKMWTDLLHEVHLAAAERDARLLLRKRDPRNRLHRGDGRAVRVRRCGPQPALRPAGLADLGGHDTALRFNRRWKALPSRYSVSGPESRSAQPLPARSCAFGRRSAMTSRPSGRVSSATTPSRDRRLSSPAWTICCCGRSPCRLPAPVGDGHHAGGGPIAGAESRERLAATATRVRARPVVRRRQPPVGARATCTSRRAPAPGSNGARSRRGDSRPCSRRRRRPCRCAAACRRRSRGTRPRSAP